MIIEGIVTSCDLAGQANVAAMGALLNDPDIDHRHTFDAFVLRPYRSARTLHNLMQCSYGVFHIVDDAELIAKLVVDRSAVTRQLVQRPNMPVPIVATACRWYAFAVDQCDVVDARATVRCRVTSMERNRDCNGLNRATFAVLEAAILATRVGYCDLTDWRDRLGRLRPLVQKTGSVRAQRAFDLLYEFLQHNVD